MAMKNIVGISILLAILFVINVYAREISFVGEGCILEPNEEITVYIQTDVPLFLLEAIIEVQGDANITSVMSPADANDYGWQGDVWPVDPYVDDVNNILYLGGVSWPGEANGTVAYFKFRYYSGQVIVSALEGFASDVNCQHVTPFLADDLIFGEEPNDFGGDSYSQDNEDKSAEDFNLPLIGSYESPQEKREKHLIYCPPNSKEKPAVLSKTEYLEEFADKNEYEQDKDGGEGMLDGLEDAIEISSDITTNQLWTTDNSYHITADVNV